MKLCPIDGCRRVVLHPGGHTKKRSECSVEGCAKLVKGNGLCHTHNARRAKGQDLNAPLRNAPKKCGVEGCKRPFSAKGFCLSHYGQAHNGRNVTNEIRSKATPGSGWEGKYGYRYGSFGGKRKLVHRHLMEESLGRPLEKHETVHHKNGSRADNRLKKGHELGGCPSSCCNLELWSSFQPRGQRVTDKIDYALQILRTYYPGPKIVIEGGSS